MMRVTVYWADLDSVPESLRSLVEDDWCIYDGIPLRYHLELKTDEYGNGYGELWPEEPPVWAHALRIEVQVIGERYRSPRCYLGEVHADEYGPWMTVRAWVLSGAETAWFWYVAPLVVVAFAEGMLREPDQRPRAALVEKMLERAKRVCEHVLSGDCLEGVDS